MMKNKGKLYIILSSLILMIASIPVFCMYIIDGGIVREWTALMLELSQGSMTLLPDMEFAAENGIPDLVLNSNLFHFLPALFLRWSGNIQWTWVVLLFCIQLGSLGGAILLYCYVCQDKVGSICGILLYMTMPFRIYLCYDRADISQALMWMLLPYYLWCLLHILDNKKRWIFVLLSMVFLAAVGYANAAVFPVIVCLTLLAGVAARDIFLPVTALGGMVLALPGLRSYLEFLLSEETTAWYVSGESIMLKGYTVGEWFSCFIYPDDRPGIGAGLLFVLFLLAWNKFVDNRSVLQKKDIVYLAAGALFLIFSLQYFPWDLVQRIHPVFMKMIALFRTPGLFLHFACFLLTVPGAGMMSGIYRENDRYNRVFLTAVLFTICISTNIYQCNTYIFSRLPL